MKANADDPMGRRKTNEMAGIAVHHQGYMGNQNIFAAQFETLWPQFGTLLKLFGAVFGTGTKKSFKELQIAGAGNFRTGKF